VSFFCSHIVDLFDRFQPKGGDVWVMEGSL